MDRRTAIKNIAWSLGVSVSSFAVMDILKSCTKEKSVLSTVFFNQEEMHVVDHLIDIILPKTSSLGGAELNLAQFVDKMCKYVLLEENQRLMKLGVKEFVDRFVDMFGKTIARASANDYGNFIKTYFNPSKEDEVFGLLGQDLKNLNRKLKSDYHFYSFFTTVRAIGLLGYFTSQPISEEYF